MGMACPQGLNMNPNSYKGTKAGRAPHNVPIHTSARYGIGCSTSGRNAYRLTLVPHTQTALARTTRARGMAPVRAKFDDDEPSRLIPNAEKVYKWVNGRRVEVDSSQVLNAEQDKALWSKVVSESQKETMIEAEFAPPPPRYVRETQMQQPEPQRRSSDIRDGGLTIKKADFTVNSIMDKIRRGKLDLKPSYQREYVWDNKTASRLIESLLLNVPIPTLFFHEIRNGCLEVVDGKQRLTSIWSYIQEQFPDAEPFRLSGLEVFEELNGAAFSDLSESQQETIKDYAINVHTIAHQSQPEFVFEVFERLNMGSTQLNEQELRNCIYQGSYTMLLGDLAHSEHLLQILGQEEPHMRMKDRELILRFFAMQRTTPYAFSIPVKSWLNTEMRENKHMPPESAESMRERFEIALQLAWDVFGENAFRIKAGDANINVALWDTVLYSFSLRDPKQVLKHKAEVAKALGELCADSKFRRLLVSQSKAVIARHEAMEIRLSNIMD